MRLTPVEIQKLEEARAQFGSTAMLRAFIDTHEVDADRIMTMMGKQGAERTFDLIFGVLPRSPRKPGSVALSEQGPTGVRVSERTIAGPRTEAPARVLPERVPERAQASSGLKARKSTMGLPIAGNLEKVLQHVAGYTTPEQLSTSVKQMATSRKMPVELVLAIMRQESNFNPLARSKAGAVGLMQLMPDAAKQTGLSITKKKDEREEPMRNLQSGLDYLAWLRDTYKIRTIEDLLGAYNAGPARLKGRKYQKIKETADYIIKVRGYMAEYKKSPELMEKHMGMLHNAVKLMALKKGDI